MKKVLLLTVMCVLGLFGVRAQDVITIGEGTETSYAIADNYDGHGASQHIYTAEEIGSAGTITSIAFQKAGGANYDRTWSIYMKHIDEENFTGNYNYTMTSDELVYEGTFSTTDGWIVFNVGSFQYDGERNLLVTVVDNSGAYGGDQLWYYTQYALEECSKCLTKYFTADIDITQQTGFSAFAGRFNIQLTMTVAGEGDDNTGEEGDDNTGEEGDDNTGEEGDDNTGEEGDNEDAEFLICERFENYEVGDKIAEKGNECWTTWSTTVGGEADGVVAEFDGRKCAHFTKGNDQVLRLGNYSSGSYELEFDAYVPEGKCGYYNLLHHFAGSSSVWAMENYLHMKYNGQSQVQAANVGVISVDNGEQEYSCVFDAWMHFRYVIDINTDEAKFYGTMPGAEETLIYEWKWSAGSASSRQLSAMNFYPPLATSDFYVDNITLKQLSAEGVAVIVFNPETVEASADVNDVTSVEFVIENTGTTVADFAAWIDYGTGADNAEKMEMISYAPELDETSAVIGLNVEEPTIIEIGAMYSASAYASSVAGTKITHIIYPFAEIQTQGDYGIVQGSDVVFRIYKQGFNGQPGECLAEKTLPYSEIQAGWVAAELDEPVLLTGFNVWATVSLLQGVPSETTPQMPLVFDNKPEGLAPYGDVLRINNEGPFYMASELFQTKYGNVHIAIVCSGDPVFGGWAELEKVDGTLKIGESTTMTVNFTTFGLEKGKTYEAKIVCAAANAEELFEAPLSLRIWGEDVEEILSNTYNIYPNPTTGMVTVEGDNIDFVAVYNSVGQLVKVVKTQASVVDMSAYENGVYFFNVVDNAGQSSVQRVVVAK